MSAEKDLKTRLMLSPEYLQFALQVMMTDNEDIDLDVLKTEFDEETYREREGGFGKPIQYVPAKHYRERLNEALGHKWTFLIVDKQIVAEPQYRRYDKDEEGYVWFDGSPYVEVLGMLIVPGLAVHMSYGVKKIQGDTESDCVKAATTDALKKCCENLGMTVDYDEELEHDSGSGNNNKKRKGEIDIDDLEFDDDELEDALEMEVGFGKFKGQTLEDIVEDDPEYLDWLYKNANEQEMADAAAIVYKNHLNVEAETKSKRRGGKSSSKSTKSTKSTKGTGSSSKASSKTSERASKSESKSTKSTKSRTSKPKETEDEDEKEEFIDTINEIFEDDETYDEVTIQSLISSVSISRKYPQGKSELEQLSLNELKKLAEVLADDLEDDEDE